MKRLPSPAPKCRSAACRGVTIIEVLASALLIFLGLGAIFGMNTQSLSILRRTRQAATSSLILQERIELLRNHPWPEISRGAAVATLLQTPALSARDLADADPTETIVISVPVTAGSKMVKMETIKVQRRHGVVQVIQDADFLGEPLLLVEMRIAWREMQRTQERQVRTIIGRSGLTRSGIFGSAFGRPEHWTTENPAPP